MLRLVHLGLFLALLLVATGCERANNSATSNPSDVRIISLSPAISRTLIDFNLQDRIVGRTPHCKSISQSIPVAGDLMNIDYESMIRLKPTHVLVQPPTAGIDQHLVDLAKQQNWKIGEWRLNGRDDIETMIRELPEMLFASQSAALAQASKRSAELLNGIASALSPGSAPLFHGRTLILHSIDPVLVSGAGTYLEDVLTTLGAENATTARGWAQLSLEDIVRLNPEAIIVVRPGANEAEAEQMRQAVNELQVEAVRLGRVAVATSPDGEMPSSGIINIATEFRQMLVRFQVSTN